MRGRRRRDGPDPREMQAQDAANREAAQAQSSGVSRAMSETGPAVDPLGEMSGSELWDKLTDADVTDPNGEEYQGLEDVLAPYLSSSAMLSAHDDGEYYDDKSNRLLNENLADRVVRGREYGDLCTGIFRQIAQEEDGDDFSGIRSEFSQAERESVRKTLAETRTDRQSLGDGSFLEAITEMHVSSHVSREDGAGAGGNAKGWKSLLPGF